MTLGHVALVTGAGRGIGAAIAARLARAGAGVLVGARSQEACLDVCSAILAAGGRAWPLYIDVTDPDSIASALEEGLELAADAGPIDWLVNNAGIGESARFLDHQRASGVDLYAKHLRVNFDGPRLLIEALAPAMIERGYGRIVNVASSAGLRGYAYAAAYCASKHALVGYSRSAAEELAKTGVTLNLVCPHFVDSPMTETSIARIVKKTGRSAEEARRLLAAENPGGTFVSPDEIAEVVRELLEGDLNGAIAELVGGRGSSRVEETIVWHRVQGR